MESFYQKFKKEYIEVDCDSDEEEESAEVNDFELELSNLNVRDEENEKLEIGNGGQSTKYIQKDVTSHIYKLAK